MSVESAPEIQQPKEQPVVESYSVRLKKIVGALAATYVLHFESGQAVAAEHDRPKRPEVSIEYVSREEPQVTPEQQKDFAKDLEYVQRTFGPSYEQYLLQAHEGKKRQRGETPDHPRITGFEKIGIDNEDLAAIWNDEYFPQGWIDGTIPSIQNVDGIRSDSSKKGEYKKGENKTGSGARASGRSRQADNAVELDARFIQSEIRDPRDIVIALHESFTHETVHDNDWDNDADLTLRERVDFLSDVARAFDAPGAYRGFNDCVNTIKNPDKGRERVHKVSEYWAMLGELYFNSPKDFKRLTSAEQQLAQKWIRRDDVMFNPEKALAKKAALLERVEQKKFEPAKKRPVDR
jgi:hypothetical protein